VRCAEYTKIFTLTAKIVVLLFNELTSGQSDRESVRWGAGKSLAPLGRSRLVGLDAGAARNVSLGGALAEAALAVRTLDVVRGVHRLGRRQVGQFASGVDDLLHLARLPDGLDEILVLLAPVVLATPSRSNSNLLQKHIAN